MSSSVCEKRQEMCESEKAKIINFCIVYSLNIKYSLMQSTITQMLYIFGKRRRHLVEITLSHLLYETPPNELLDIGPILRLSQERSIWRKKRSSDWWEEIVKNHFKDDDWLESFRVRKCTFMWLCDQLKNELAPSANQLGVREPVSIEKQVAVCL